MTVWSKRTGLVFVMCASLTACGGGGSEPAPVEDTGPNLTTVPPPDLPAERLTQQESINQSKFELTLNTYESVQKLVTQWQADGYTEYTGYGMLEDDSKTSVVWATIAEPNSEPLKERTLALRCNADGDCVGARVRVQNGSALFTDPDGQTVSALTIGAPVLSKVLDGHDHDGKTTINKVSGALTAGTEVTLELGKRRFTVASAYGDVFGVSLSGMKSIASGSGAFTDVTIQHYAGPETVENALLTSSPFDVFVWVGASVLEDMGGGQKTIGMTVNRGVFGDQTFQASQIKDLLEATPLGGPGLVVLVGEQSWGDGSGEETHNLSLFKELAENFTRTVVGFKGRGDVSHLIEATNVFLTNYVGGATLSASLEAANQTLADRGSTAEVVTSGAATGEETLPGPLASFWGENPSPAGVRTTIYINITNVCIPADGSDPYNENEGQANFFVDVNFDGPFFSGSRVSPDVGLDVKVKGVLLGTKPSDRLYLQVSGDLKKSVKGIILFGAGVVVANDDPDHPNRVYFGGEATATEYINEKGDTCHLKTPKLTGTTSQPGWFDLPYGAQ